MMRGRLWLRLAIGLALGCAGAIVVWASWDGSEPPTWGLAKPTYDPHGSAAMLLPSNDTRVNLYLLLADRRGAVMRDPKAKEEGPPLILFSWTTMADRMTAAEEEPQPDEPVAADTSSGVWNEPSRCQSEGRGAAEFTEAVNASRDIPSPEKQMLIEARQRIAPAVRTVRMGGNEEDCGTAQIAGLDLTKLTSASARDFASYVYAAQSFYDADFDLATERFRNLAARRQPWVREAALYMVGRSELNLAMSRSTNEYGEIEDSTKRDRVSAVAAGAGFAAYLTAYPTGRYASSARGLMRRTHWLAGDTASLANDYGAQIASKGPFDGAESDRALIEELDQKLPLPTNSPQGIRDPVLLAVVDLHRMRRTEGYPFMHVSRDYKLPGEEYPGEQISRADCCGPAITKAEIERQRPLFGGDTELYDYVRAAEAYFVRRQPREVLRLIPDAAHQKRFSYLQFSRQMLRGMALQDVGDRNARAFLLSLFPGAVQPYQRGALELALAMQEEKSGRLDLVFAPDSEVRHPIIRQLLLEHVAGPGLLRRQATQSNVPKMEREVALYMLLTKELRRGLYREFLSDVRLLPADATADTYYGGAASYDAEYYSDPERPPLGRLGTGAKLGNAGCAILTTTASQLADNPRAVRPRLCLAEFFRRNGFDDFGDFDTSIAGNGLASTPPQFPATPYSRLEVYKSVINDPTASPDDKALALNRAVRCYAPGGNNSCDGKEVSLAVRRGWFNRLKAQYPQSNWAKELDYYW